MACCVTARRRLERPFPEPLSHAERGCGHRMRKSGRFLGCRRCTRLLARLRRLPRAQGHAADLREPYARLPQGDRSTVLGLHAVHKVEHVARGATAAGMAAEEAFGQVNTTTRPRIVVEGAVHLGLVARARGRKAIVEKHSTEIRASFEIVKVEAMFFGHAVPIR